MPLQVDLSFQVIGLKSSSNVGLQLCKVVKGVQENVVTVLQVLVTVKDKMP